MMIRASGLSKTYGRTTALNDVSFQVKEGEILGFLGPNGAGKTTTMRILTGHTPPTSGEATVAGFDVVKESLSVRKIIGYMPETPGLYPDMTVKDYLGFMAEIKGLPYNTRREEVRRSIKETDLRMARERLIRNLSKGFRQRVGLAQALLGDPKVLVLDEPTVGLDPAQIREIRDLIRSMKGKKTVILSTHILPEVTAICSRIIIINLGKIVAEGSANDLASRLAPERRFILIISGDTGKTLQILKNRDEVSLISTPQPLDAENIHRIEFSASKDVRAEISRAVINAGIDLLELKPVTAGLEDVYMQAVMGREGF